MTGLQMCEVIAWCADTDVDPEAIWNASSTGEIYPVFELFYLADVLINEYYFPRRTIDV